MAVNCIKSLLWFLSLALNFFFQSIKLGNVVGYSNIFYLFFTKTISNFIIRIILNGARTSIHASPTSDRLLHQMPQILSLPLEEKGIFMSSMATNGGLQAGYHYKWTYFIILFYFLIRRHVVVSEDIKIWDYV